MRRHDLAYLHPTADYQWLSCATDTAVHEAVQQWLLARRPLVVARQPVSADSRILLGLTLPPNTQPRRISVSVRPNAIQAISPPLSLAHCLDKCTASIAEPLRLLLQRCDTHNITVSVYGSLAWEMLSAMTYRHSQSDVDVICDIALVSQLAPCMEALQQAQHALPCSLDGEIRFANGPAVNWKELSQALQQPSLRVVAKDDTSVTLLPLAELLSHLGEHEHVC